MHCICYCCRDSHRKSTSKLIHVRTFRQRKNDTKFAISVGKSFFPQSTWNFMQRPIKQTEKNLHAISVTRNSSGRIFCINTKKLFMEIMSTNANFVNEMYVLDKNTLYIDIGWKNIQVIRIPGRLKVKFYTNFCLIGPFLWLKWSNIYFFRIPK